MKYGVCWLVEEEVVEREKKNKEEEVVELC